MKPSKNVVRVLMALGFGGAVGLTGGCGANRAQRSRPADGAPVADTVVVPGHDQPVRVMYGVPPARFDPNRPIPQVAPGMRQDNPEQ